MRKKVLFSILSLFLFLIICGSAWAEDLSAPAEFPHHTIMKPDPETLQRWAEQFKAAPRVTLDPKIADMLKHAELTGSATMVNLTSFLKYTPSERNQGDCGNCWVWAGTGVMEIALNINEGLYDRLSEQLLDSCYNYGTGGAFACCGGTESDLAGFYSKTGSAIPWSDYDASFVDENASYGCAPPDKIASGWSSMGCGAISTWPSYPLLSISDEVIPTQGEGQANAIAHIKNVLQQNRGVVFGVSWADGADFRQFEGFWNNNSETDVWDPDTVCGDEYVAKESGGHALLIVGYDDSGSTPYWLVLNSWGAPANRPNGLFRMKMNMNYDCTIKDWPYSNPVREFETLNVGYGTIPITRPEAPAEVTAVAGNAKATVSFVPEVAPGGYSISFTVTSNPGGISMQGASSPITVTGLKNGTSYTFTAEAINPAGASPASSPSNKVTPEPTVPGAPTGVKATAGNGQATVSFTAPASNGGSPITSYTVSYPIYIGIQFIRWVNIKGASSPIVVTDLTNGTAYTFTVTATNAVGEGPAATSNTVTPVTVPGAPTGVTASAGNAQATVSFTAPASNGGSPITSYTVTSTPGGISQDGASSPIVVTGLKNGTAYTFTVKATNAAGTGVASSPSNKVTPMTIPGAPTGVKATAGNGQATVSFTAPASNGGSPITSYTVYYTYFNGITFIRLTVNGALSPIVVKGLTNGSTYQFAVTATNAVGEGLMSANSNAVTPATVPGAPTGVTASAGNAQAAVSFTAPASDGGSPITSYTVTSTPGGVTKQGTTSPIVVTGLKNLIPYTFTVKATNTAGTGMASSPSNVVVPRIPIILDTGA
jgi:hypothetical protein